MIKIIFERNAKSSLSSEWAKIIVEEVDRAEILPPKSQVSKGKNQVWKMYFLNNPELKYEIYTKNGNLEKMKFASKGVNWLKISTKVLIRRYPIYK